MPRHGGDRRRNHHVNEQGAHVGRPQRIDVDAGGWRGSEDRDEVSAGNGFQGALLALPRPGMPVCSS